MPITKEIAHGIMHLAQVKRKARIDLKDIRRNLREAGQTASESNINAIIEMIQANEFYSVIKDDFQKCYYVNYTR